MIAETLKQKNTIMYILVICMFGLFLLIFTTSSANAQSSAVTISATPINPGPGDEVLISLNGPSSDLLKASISWYFDGELKLSRVGEDAVRITAGDVGKSIVVRADIVFEGGQTTSRSITIKTTEVNILYEAVSYVPPFYKGKALNVTGGLVKFTAIPNLVDKNGNKVDPNNIIYKWEQKGIELTGASGLGNQSIVLESPTSNLDTLQITVNAVSQNGLYSARKTIRVPLRNPELLFYESSPLQGVLYNKAYTLSSDGISVDKASIVLRAEPYYFSSDDVILGKLAYRWKIQGENVNIPRDKQGMELEIRSDGIKGVVEVALNILSNNLPFRVFQEASSKVKLNFK